MEHENHELAAIKCSAHGDPAGAIQNYDLAIDAVQPGMHAKELIEHYETRRSECVAKMTPSWLSQVWSNWALRRQARKATNG